MKKLISTMLLFVGFKATDQNQLNSNSQLIKERVPEIYNKIKTLCSKRWEGDHKMMVYTINGQCDAFIELQSIKEKSNYDENTFLTALDWVNSVHGGDLTDYKRLVHVYKNQY